MMHIPYITMPPAAGRNHRLLHVRFALGQLPNHQPPTTRPPTTRPPTTRPPTTRPPTTRLLDYSTTDYSTTHHPSPITYHSAAVADSLPVRPAGAAAGGAARRPRRRHTARHDTARPLSRGEFPLGRFVVSGVPVAAFIAAPAARRGDASLEVRTPAWVVSGVPVTVITATDYVLAKKTK